jgi:hypothetical protein
MGNIFILLENRYKVVELIIDRWLGVVHVLDLNFRLFYKGWYRVAALSKTLNTD